MAVVGIMAGDFAYPSLQLATSSGIGGAAMLIDASAEYAACVFRVPKTGNLRSFACRISAITNAPDNGLRFSFQDVSATTGLPDGGVDQFATIAGASLVAGWNDPGNFDADRAVVKGQLVAAVVDFPSFVAGDSVTLIGCTDATLGSLGMPYGALNGARSSVALGIALLYDDGSYGYLNNFKVYPHASSAAPAFNVDTAGFDEYGLSFSVPGPSRSTGMTGIFDMNAGGTFELLLYRGTTVLRTATVDSDQIVSANARHFSIEWDDGPQDIQANVVYTVAIRPTSTIDAAISYVTIPSLAIMQGAWVGGDAVYLSARLNQGAWTHYNNATDGFARPAIAVLLSAFQNSPPFIIGG